MGSISELGGSYSPNRINTRFSARKTVVGASLLAVAAIGSVSATNSDSFSPVSPQSASEHNLELGGIQNIPSTVDTLIARAQGQKFLAGPAEIAKDSDCRIPMIEVSADEYEAHTAKGEKGVIVSITNSTTTTKYNPETGAYDQINVKDPPLISYLIDDPNNITCDNTPIAAPITP